MVANAARYIRFASLALLAVKSCVRKLFEVEGQRVGRNSQLIGKGSGREPVSACHDQRTEDAQTHFLGQGRGTRYVVAKAMRRALFLL